MEHIKRTISLIMAALMIGANFASCSGETQQPAKQDAETGEPAPDSDAPKTDSANENGTEEENPVYRADIPSGTDYGGYNFRVKVMDLSTIVWYDTDFSVEEPSAEVVEQAVYQRKLNVEEQLGVKLSPVYTTGSMADSITQSVLADDDSFDVCFCAPLPISGQVTNGLFVNLNHFPNLNLDDPWWDAHAKEDLTVDGKLYLAAGDIGYNYKRSTSVLFFNKKMIVDYGLDDPYEMVENNRWTMAKMFEMADTVTDDTNGDGEIKAPDDLYGFAHCPDTIYQMLIAGDVRMARNNSEGIPEITFMTEHTADVFSTLTDMFYNGDRTFNWEQTGVNAGTKFTSGALLFMPTEFWVITTFRDMDTDFGVLPMPKYDEGQADFHHCVNQTVAAMLLVPKTNRDHERTGHVVSALGAEGKNLITPAYYEVALKTKYSRDMESEAMFDVIFNSLTWDPGFMYDLGGVKAMLLGMANGKQSDLASTWKKYERIAEKNLEKMVKAYAALND